MALPLAYAQDEMEPDEAPEQAPVKKEAAPLPKEDAPPGTLIPAPGSMTDLPVAELQALDKITARVSSLDVKVGDTVTFGSLAIAVKACRKSSPEDAPEAAAFLQIWEQKPGEDSHWVYSGWMFASSPALAAMDHPVYDIWVVDCKKEATSAASSPPASVEPPAR